MTYVGIMSNERHLCALSAGWWRVNQIVYEASTETSEFLLFHFNVFVAKRTRLLFHRVAFKTKKQKKKLLTGFSALFQDPLILCFFVCFETLQGEWEEGGQSMKKIPPPERVWNSNLRTFKDVRVHLMHTYHGIRRQPRPVSFNCQSGGEKKQKGGNDLLWKIALFQKKRSHTVFQPAWN